MADEDLGLREGENVIEQMKGDYWEKQFLCFYSQSRGKYWLTSERILYKGGWGTNLELPYSDIAEVKKCMVGPFIPFLPTGVKVTLKDGKSYKLSLMGRGKYIEFIQKQLKG